MRVQKFLAASKNEGSSQSAYACLMAQNRPLTALNVHCCQSMVRRHRLRPCAHMYSSGTYVWTLMALYWNVEGFPATVKFGKEGGDLESAQGTSWWNLLWVVLWLVIPHLSIDYA